MTEEEAFRKLDAGELRGTILELRLLQRRYDIEYRNKKGP